MKLKIVKGTRDLYGADIKKFQFIEDKCRKIFNLYGYSEIRTPVLENTELFARGVGEDTDIVGKEMYSLQDRRGRSLTLRPEGTASVVRHVITNTLMNQNKSVKYFYIGPMFRYEQPQKGRYRQFYQIGVEYFGVPTPDADLEMMLMLQQLFNEINLKSVSFQINTIGCQNENCRPQFKKNLVTYLKERSNTLCTDCQRRMENNPLRVLDCKNPTCKEITKSAPKIHEEVCEDCKTDFSELKSLLDAHEVIYDVNEKLVRGLDYYSKTVFEVYSENLGAQSAAGGGGRYDGLFEIYGAPTVPAVGFALGLDRLVLLMDEGTPTENNVFVVGKDRKAVCKLVDECRQAGYSTIYDPFLSSMKSQFRQANKTNSRVVLVLGEDEIANGNVSVKDMKNSEQNIIPVQSLKTSLFEVFGF